MREACPCVPRCESWVRKSVARARGATRERKARIGRKSGVSRRTPQPSASTQGPGRGDQRGGPLQHCGRCMKPLSESHFKAVNKGATYWVSYLSQMEQTQYVAPWSAAYASKTRSIVSSHPWRRSSLPAAPAWPRCGCPDPAARQRHRPFALPAFGPPRPPARPPGGLKEAIWAVWGPVGRRERAVVLRRCCEVGRGPVGRLALHTPMCRAPTTTPVGQLGLSHCNEAGAEGRAAKACAPKRAAQRLRTPTRPQRRTQPADAPPFESRRSPHLQDLQPPPAATKQSLTSNSHALASRRKSSGTRVTQYGELGPAATKQAHPSRSPPTWAAPSRIAKGGPRSANAHVHS
jgi:hypothetical protein